MAGGDRMIERGGLFPDRQRADLERAALIRLVLDHRHRHLDHAVPRDRRDPRRGQADRAGPRMFRAIVAAVIGEAERRQHKEGIIVRGIAAAAEGDRQRCSGFGQQFHAAHDQITLIVARKGAQFERIVQAAILQRGAAPVGMEMKLHLLPRRQDRRDDRAKLRDAIDQRRHRIDEEGRLQPMPGKQIELMRDPHPRRFQRPRDHLLRRQAGGMMPPAQLGVDRQKNLHPAKRI